MPRTFPVRRPEPSFRYLNLGVWLFVNVALLFVVALHWLRQFSLSDEMRAWAVWLSEINTRQWIYLSAPLITFLSTVITHSLDDKKGGGGIRHRAAEINGIYNLDAQVISATMTKQSVLAAIASILIIVVQGARGLLQPGAPPPHFSILVERVATVGFLIAILLILLSVKTYDYANRFKWENHQSYQREEEGEYSYYRVRLVGKALQLDIYSYYFLLFSFVLSTALIKDWLPIFASIACGVLLWLCYFFPLKGKSGEGPAAATTGSTGVER